jgi:Amt family ammonium transporter
MKHKFGYDDSLDVVGVHLVGGLVGTLMIGMVGDEEFAAGSNGLLLGGGLDLLGRQAIAAFAVMAYSFVITFLIAYLIKLTIGLRVTEEEELAGIDQSVHAETAYELMGGLAGNSNAGPSAARPPAAAGRKSPTQTETVPS